MELLIRILKDLHTHNYVIKPLTVSAAMKHLIDCNVLFYNGESIQPSRRIMMHAIRELLHAIRELQSVNFYNHYNWCSLH